MRSPLTVRGHVALAGAAFMLVLAGLFALAHADDSDLQQYNRPAANAEAANAAGALTGPVYLVRDGKKVTADSNAAGSAPINRSVKQLADALAGLRCATQGGCSGVNARTAKSLRVDGTGGAVSSAPSGNIEATGAISAGTNITAGGSATIHGSIDASAGNITADAGDLVAAVGNINAFTGNINALSGDIAAQLGSVRALNGTVVAGDQTTPRFGRLKTTGVDFVGTQTGTTGANPPRGTSLLNQIRAKNIVKHWIRVGGAGGTVTLMDGAGNWSAAVVDLGGGKNIRYRLRITMGDAMDNTSYSVTCTSVGPDVAAVAPIPMLLNDTMTTTVFDITEYLISSSAFLPFNSSAFELSCVVMGQQTS